jgi:tRNA A-37 threonylcarbamoyl transferase component Bud32
MSQFPNRQQYDCEQVNLDPEIPKLWSSSTFVDYGADAVLRCSHVGPYPIMKLSHPDQISRARIQHEISMIKDMTRTSQVLPIPKMCDSLLSDGLGVFGYRPERLTRLERRELQSRLPEVREAVRFLHQAGFSHGDLSPSNVMKNDQGAIILIDFGYAGRIGTMIPNSVPTWVYPHSTFSPDVDSRALLDQLNAE